MMKQNVYFCSAQNRVTRVSTICHKPNGVLLSADDREAHFIGRLDLHAANCWFGNADFRTLCIASADKFIGIRTNATGLKALVLRVPKAWLAIFANCGRIEA